MPKGQVELKVGQGKQKTHLPTGQVLLDTTVPFLLTFRQYLSLSYTAYKFSIASFFSSTNFPSIISLRIQGTFFNLWYPDAICTSKVLRGLYFPLLSV